MKKEKIIDIYEFMLAQSKEMLAKNERITKEEVTHYQTATNIYEQFLSYLYKMD